MYVIYLIYILYTCFIYYIYTYKASVLLPMEMKQSDCKFSFTQ